MSLWQRWVSASIGEGLIFDMRTQVFGHVQRMPIAFFSRTQTGALVSRLNNDVLGAQQAFTDTLSSVVGNVDHRHRHARRDVHPVVADHAASRWLLLPAVHAARRAWIGRSGSDDHAGELRAQRADEHHA